MSSVVDVLCALQSVQIRKTLLSCYRFFFQGVLFSKGFIYFKSYITILGYTRATTCLRKNRSCLVACTGTILYFLTKDDPRQPCVQNSTLWISLVFEISFFLRTLFALSRELRNPAVVVYHILARFNLNSLEWISKLNILDSTSEIFFWIPGSGLNHIQSFRPRKDHANHSLFLYPKVRAPVCHQCT